MGTVTKIGIVGMGHVGAHVANSLVLQGIGDELYMTEQCLSLIHISEPTRRTQ